MGDDQEQIRVQVQMDTRNLKTLPFVPPEEQIKIGPAWEKLA